MTLLDPDEPDQFAGWSVGGRLFSAHGDEPLWLISIDRPGEHVSVTTDWPTWRDAYTGQPYEGPAECDWEAPCQGVFEADLLPLLGYDGGADPPPVTADLLDILIALGEAPERSVIEPE